MIEHLVGRMHVMGEIENSGPELGLREGMRIDVGDIQGCLFVGVLTRFRCDELTGCVEMTVQ